MKVARLEIQVRTNCLKSTCLNCADTIKYLEINLQSFQNLEVGGVRLEIEVQASYINNTCIRSVLVYALLDILPHSFCI